MNDDLVGRKMFCTIDGKEIPKERGKKAVTCSKECGDIRIRMLRAKRSDDKECRFCKRPATPNARKAFSRFRRWERDNPALAYPEQWAVLEPAGVELATFGRAIQQAIKFDVDFESHWSDFAFGSMKPLPEGDAMPKEMGQVLAILAAVRKEDPVAEPAAV